MARVHSFMNVTRDTCVR